MKRKKNARPEKKGSVKVGIKGGNGKELVSTGKRIQESSLRGRTDKASVAMRKNRGRSENGRSFREDNSGLRGRWERVLRKAKEDQGPRRSQTTRIPTIGGITAVLEDLRGGEEGRETVGGSTWRRQ